VGPTNTQELRGSVRVEVTTIKNGEGLVEELEGQVFCELRFGILALSARPARRASLFVDLATLGLLKA